ncbi:recombination regulator RecX [Corynebacterium cystitidis]|uniref:recombination regulator RecX n=1 Tax=Corynebacterium cystitidis TaxID=35757 RepID=UPI00211DD019|nr:recombination regulator RecX [Corynebacterium cystitidis]
MAAEPDPEKVAKLQAAIEEYESGASSALFDRSNEEALAPVRKRALGLLDQRARSRHELRERLLKAEFAPELVNDVCDEFERTGLLNDQTFAREWVRQRAARRGKSSRALDRELQEKGVASAIRVEAISQLSAEDEEKTARVIAEKKARSVKEVPEDRAAYDKVLRRVVGALARRGFPSAMSFSIAKAALDDQLEQLH